MFFSFFVQIFLIRRWWGAGWGAGRMVVACANFAGWPAATWPGSRTTSNPFTGHTLRDTRASSARRSAKPDMHWLAIKVDITLRTSRHLTSPKKLLRLHRSRNRKWKRRKKIRLRHPMLQTLRPNRCLGGIQDFAESARLKNRSVVWVLWKHKPLWIVIERRFLDRKKNLEMHPKYRHVLFLSFCKTLNTKLPKKKKKTRNFRHISLLSVVRIVKIINVILLSVTKPILDSALKPSSFNSFALDELLLC